MVHQFVGGSMNILYYASQDWLYFMHYAFIDKIWTTFRQMHANDPAANR
jgi:hypothetical protein